MISISGKPGFPAVALVLALVPVLVAPTVHARDMRHPTSGRPAFILSVPDDWTPHKMEQEMTLSVVSPDHRIAFALTIAAADSSADEVVEAAVKQTNGTLIGKQDISLSGYPGSLYNWTYINAKGLKLHVALTIIKIGAIFATCSRLEVDGNSAAVHQLADTVMQSVKIIPAGDGK